MELLQLSSHGLCSLSHCHSFRYITKPNKALIHTFNSKRPSFVKTKIRAVGTVPEKDSRTTEPEEPPSIGFAFVNVVVQQLPEWKGHEWKYEKLSPEELESELESS